MPGIRRIWPVLILFMVVIALLPSSTTQAVPSALLVFGSSNGGNSDSPVITPDGRYIAFSSTSNDLVANDTNDKGDIFVVDTATGIYERVSVDNNGNQANDHSTGPGISADGRYIAFSSSATNLVPGDTNNTADAFVYDREIGTIERISVDDSGNQGNGGSGSVAITADGQYIAFMSVASNLVFDDINNTVDIFVYDRDTHTTMRISVNDQGHQSNDWSRYPSISADGRYIAFESLGSNLVTEDTNDSWDVFLYDRTINVIKRISTANDGNQSNGSSSAASIAANGNYVVFQSAATNLIPNDTNDSSDVFLYEMEMNTVKRVSVDSEGKQVDWGAVNPAISPDGRYIAFMSSSNNLVPGVDINEVNIFRHDSITGTTDIASSRSDNVAANDWSVLRLYHTTQSISDAGNVVFRSSATNLVPEDTDSDYDIYLALFTLHPTFTSHPAPDGVIGTLYSHTFAADGDATITFSTDDTLPDGLTLSGDTLSGTPTVGGTFSGTITATNAAGTDTQAFSIFIATPPSITSDEPPNGVVGMPYTHTFTADGDTPITYEVTSGALPDGLSLSTAGVISGTPTMPGTFTGEITATNNAGTDTQAFSIFIATPPTFTSTPPANGIVDVAYSHTFTATGDTPITYEVTSGALPDGLTLTDDTISGTPTVADTFTGEITASNTAGEDVQAFSITIADPAGTPPRLYPMQDAILDATTYAGPNFSFRHMDGTEWYRVWIGKTDGNRYFDQALFKWFDAAEICVEDVCTLDTPVWLTNGNYAWWITRYSQLDPNFGQKWNLTTFSVNFAAPATTVTMSSPADGATVTQAPSTISWERDTNVHWYRVWFGPETYSQGAVFYQWVDATDPQFCDATTCTIDINENAITAGEYHIYFQVWGPNGFYKWGGVNGGQPQTFTVGSTQ